VLWGKLCVTIDWGLLVGSTHGFELYDWERIFGVAVPGCLKKSLVLLGCKICAIS